ncbi:hypothetical protein FN976_23925 [Caenimonas sedimenti]|uniref:Uncharacterized protein n=1 Tax=Caenimonas sedimenti TaxID=2596921 RepID=A0A562ZHC8_9BURK|nr:hypothetical protein [Caenimonas sedimenti]TWO68000.1 hypothetical protein FN976_23925 [Caenimonas sedimenti]
MTTLTRAAAIFLGISTSLLSGCATVDEHGHRFSEGWRNATVVRLLKGSEIERPRFWTCTRDVPEAQRLGRDYVVVSYRGVNRQQQHLAAVAPDLSLQPGEKVHVNVTACEQAVAKHSPGKQG